MEAIVVAAIGPLLTAGLAALGFVLSRRLHEHDLNTRHERAVARATAQITALEQLLRVYEAAAEPAERETVRRQVLAGLEQARADLEHAYAALRGAGDVTAPRGGTTDLPAVRRLVEAVLMLHLRPATWPARILGIVYYVSLAWLLLWLAAAVLFGVTIAVMDDPSMSFLSRMGMSAGIFMLCLAIGAAPPLVLYLVYRGFSARPETIRP
jgi:hypothetical protein